MPRFAAQLTQQEFLDKLRDFALKLAGDPDEDRNEIVDDLDIPNAQRDELIEVLMKSFSYGAAPAALSKDLLKVEFSFENYWTPDQYSRDSHENQYGLRQIAGTTMLLTWGGGDWEWPVDFAVYWDGSNFRGYIPKAAFWNSKTKQAIGNADDELSDFKTQHPDLVKNFPDIFVETNPANVAGSLYDIIGPLLEQYPEYYDKLILDIQSRIQVK